MRGHVRQPRTGVQIVPYVSRKYALTAVSAIGEDVSPYCYAGAIGIG